MKETITIFNKEHYATLAVEDQAAYMTECFGDDEAAKEAAVA